MNKAGELHGAEGVCKTPDSGSIPALASSAYYKQIGAKSPQFADVGKRLAEMEWRGEILPEWGLKYLLEYFNHHIKCQQATIIDLSKENSLLKRENEKLNRTNKSDNRGAINETSHT